MIDWDRITELRNEIGPDDFEEVVELFLEEMEDALGTVPGAKPGDLAAVLHSLKGSALNLGFVTLARLCERGELLAATGRAGDVDRAGLLAAYVTTRTDFLRGIDRRFVA